jgi:hypothetical protein
MWPRVILCFAPYVVARARPPTDRRPQTSTIGRFGQALPPAENPDYRETEEERRAWRATSRPAAGAGRGRGGRGRAGDAARRYTRRRGRGLVHRRRAAAPRRSARCAWRPCSGRSSGRAGSPASSPARAADRHRSRPAAGPPPHGAPDVGTRTPRRGPGRARRLARRERPAGLPRRSLASGPVRLLQSSVARARSRRRSPTAPACGWTTGCRPARPGAAARRAGLRRGQPMAGRGCGRVARTARGDGGCCRQGRGGRAVRLLPR